MISLAVKGKQLGRFLTAVLSRMGYKNSAHMNASPLLPPGGQEWSIGIYVGKSPLNLVAAEDVNNPVLTKADVSDIPAGFVADPFMLKTNNMWYMFFEVWNHKYAKGEIGLAISKNAMSWTYQQRVLVEPFHLSYPYVFKWKSEYYMVPESYQSNAIRLYRAVDFPKKWSFVMNLVEGNDYVDSSVFHFEDRWWLLTGLGLPPSRAETLRLYHADQLMGPWLEHPRSPIIDGNAHIARPCGRVLVLDKTIIRYAQDCYPTYGSQVRAFEITELTATSYHEREVDGNPVLTASGAGWNASGMHHIDPYPVDKDKWIACVDGWRWIGPNTETLSQGL